MSDIENKLFDSIGKLPIYLRYVDDILILANNINEINILQDTFPKTIFYKENFIKQTPINNGFPDYIVDEQIKRIIKNISQ